MSKSKGTCNQCGVCCRIFYINLNEAEYRSGNFQTVYQDYETIKDFKEATECGANILAKMEDGSCVYLEGNKCSIHQTRPEVCKGFFCDTTEPMYLGMVRMVREQKAK